VISNSPNYTDANSYYNFFNQGEINLAITRTPEEENLLKFETNDVQSVNVSIDLSRENVSYLGYKGYSDRTLSLPDTDGTLQHVNLTLKMLLSDFVPDIASGRPNMFSIVSPAGLIVARNTAKIWGFKDIPFGHKVTHVNVHAGLNKNVAVFEYNMNTGVYSAPAGTSTGLSNTPIALTNPIQYSATTCILVSYEPGSTHPSTALFGATLTLALI